MLYFHVFVNVIRFLYFLYYLTLRLLRTSILVPPAAYVSCWGVAGAATHLSAITQSCLLCRVASRESCPTFIPFRHDKNIEWYGYCSFVFRIKMRMIFEKITFQFISTYISLFQHISSSFFQFDINSLVSNLFIFTFVDTHK